MKDRGVITFADGTVYVPPTPRGWWDRVNPFGYAVREEEAYRAFMRERGRRMWNAVWGERVAEFDRQMAHWEKVAYNAVRARRRYAGAPLRRAARRYVP